MEGSLGGPSHPCWPQHQLTVASACSSLSPSTSPAIPSFPFLSCCLAHLLGCSQLPLETVDLTRALQSGTGSGSNVGTLWPWALPWKVAARTGDARGSEVPRLQTQSFCPDCQCPSIGEWGQSPDSHHSWSIPDTVGLRPFPAPCGLPPGLLALSRGRVEGGQMEKPAFCPYPLFPGPPPAVSEFPQLQFPQDTTVWFQLLLGTQQLGPLHSAHPGVWVATSCFC